LYCRTVFSRFFYSSSSLLESYAAKLSNALGLEVVAVAAVRDPSSTFGFLFSTWSLGMFADGSSSLAFLFPVTFEPSFSAGVETVGDCVEEEVEGDCDDDDDGDDAEGGLSRLTSPAKSEVFFFGAPVSDDDGAFPLVFGACGPDPDPDPDPGSNSSATGGGGAVFNCTFLKNEKMRG
jgi:hypothetical protein